MGVRTWLAEGSFMKKGAIFIVCVMLVLSTTACTVFNDTVSSTESTENTVREIEQLSTQAKEPKEVETYTVYVYDDNGNVIKTYDNAFDVIISANGAVNIWIDNKGKESYTLVNMNVEVKKTVIKKNIDTSDYTGEVK